MRAIVSVATTLVLLALPGMTPVRAQEAGSTIPEGWVVSPQNDKARGEPGYRIRHQDTGLELVYVPAGTFMMGSTKAEAEHAVEQFGADAGRLAAEQPAHEVELSAYWIGRTEVTVGQWRQVIGEMPPPDDQGNDWNKLGDDHPILWITWDEALEFCEKLGLRLPTEAQWEYAARGPARYTFPWGNEWDEQKCCNGKNQGVEFRTFPVGSFPEGASWCGALDMAGNLWEWCSDWYDSEYYSKSPQLNPQGPAEEELTGPWKLKSARGGSWGSDGPHNFRTSYRVIGVPDVRRFAYGFRCAR